MKHRRVFRLFCIATLVFGYKSVSGTNLFTTFDFINDHCSKVKRLIGNRITKVKHKDKPHEMDVRRSKGRNGEKI